MDPFKPDPIIDCSTVERTVSLEGAMKKYPEIGVVYKRMGRLAETVGTGGVLYEFSTVLRRYYPGMSKTESLCLAKDAVQQFDLSH